MLHEWMEAPKTSSRAGQQQRGPLDDQCKDRLLQKRLSKSLPTHDQRPFLLLEGHDYGGQSLRHKKAKSFQNQGQPLSPVILEQCCVFGG